jgi:soluble lytic murein transglycosylase-like protein
VRVLAARRPFHDYRSGAYAPIESKLEQQMGIPSGLLSGLRTRGERSNANQVSEAGARSVYQIIPATRDAFLKRTGIDAYAGPASAAKIAALTLLERYKAHGDWRRAVVEYHGGLDPSNWGPRTRAYVGRVMNGQ